MASEADIPRQLRRELDATRARLAEAEEALNAIRNGEVDGLVMAGPKGKQIFTLTGAQEPYRLLIEQMSEGALTLSRTGFILYANQAFARLLQVPLERVIGAQFLAFFALADQLALADLIAAACGGSSRGELSLRAADGGLVRLRLGLSPLPLGSETLVCVVAIDLTEAWKKEDELRRLSGDLETRVTVRTSELAVSRLAAMNLAEESTEARNALEAVNRDLNRSITELKQAEQEICQLNKSLEQRVQARTADLEAANQESEAFAYSVSHDLRAPLRAIDGWAQALLEDCGDKLGEAGLALLQRQQAASQRMGALIDDLLQLSRLTRQPLSRQTVNPAALINRVWAELRAAQMQSKGELQVGNLPPCQADPGLLTQVFANLLGNALKFSSRRADACIEVGSQGTNGECVYFVKDNGAGFDMRYISKLFGAFQRLHSESEFPGTGIGLAVVQRIIRRHGGRIWAEGAVGQGATFYFTVPGAAPQEAASSAKSAVKPAEDSAPKEEAT